MYRPHPPMSRVPRRTGEPPLASLRGDSHRLAAVEDLAGLAPRASTTLRSIRTAAATVKGCGYYRWGLVFFSLALLIQLRYYPL